MTPDLCEAFRNFDGSWISTRQSVLIVSSGQAVTIEIDETIRPGELLGDYDLAAYLERVCVSSNNAV